MESVIAKKIVKIFGLEEAFRRMYIQRVGKHLVPTVLGVDWILEYEKSKGKDQHL